MSNFIGFKTMHGSKQDLQIFAKMLTHKIFKGHKVFILSNAGFKLINITSSLRVLFHDDTNQNIIISVI